MRIHKSDVAIVGGGMAGVAAALAAARGGASTAIIEALGCLGGMGTAGLVPAFAPFNYNTPGGEPYIRGIALEIVQRLERAGGVYPTSQYWKLFDKEVAKLLFDRMMREAGVRVRYFTMFSSVEMDGSRICRAITASKSGSEAWEADCFIDCSGDADVAYSAGAPCVVGGDDGEVMPPTLCFVVDGVDREKVPDVGPIAEAIIKGKESGRLRNRHDLRGIRDLYGPRAMGFNYNHVYDVDCLDADDLSRAVAEGREIAFELLEYLRETVPGFEDAYIINSGSLLGVRETRRVTGDFILTAPAYSNSEVHADDICVYDYALDLHAAANTAESRARYEDLYYRRRTKPGEYFGVPYRCLIPVGVENLAVAGRCVSCDRAMLATLRQMPACMATGEAAGTAAAIALENGGQFRRVDVPRLQATLRSNGVYLPQLQG